MKRHASLLIAVPLFCAQALNTGPAPAAAPAAVLFFDWDQADLSPHARAGLRLLATHKRASIIELRAANDPAHGAYRALLWQRRARHVIDTLVRQGVPPSRIRVPDPTHILLASATH